MSLTVSPALIDATQSAQLQRYRASAAHLRGDRELEIDIGRLDAEGLADLSAAARLVQDAKTARAIESIALARSGSFDKPVPSFKAFHAVLEAFLKTDRIDGWIYVAADDGKLYPELVTSIVYDSGDTYGRKTSPTVVLHTTSYGLHHDGNYKEAFGVHHGRHGFTPQSVAGRRLPDILAAAGLYKETPALRAEYAASIQRHYEITQDAFAKQFRVTGGVYRFEEDSWQRRKETVCGRRVIHDLPPKDVGPAQRFDESVLFNDDAPSNGLGSVPEHPIVKVFDLSRHEFFWVHADNMTPYAYDLSLREKLILPASHRDLLDVLTTDLGAFVSDFVEGKSAGNVILCKGPPGVGKTLTAEVYAELIGRPLYAIHSGALGTTAEAIEENLRGIFQRSKRWGCVLLLDEADVFVVRRGTNIEQNAIVAEFLRTLEYFDGLLFMTTNRPHDIDEAILSRCAAIIDYTTPSAPDRAAVWRVMATQFQAQLDDAMIAELVTVFPTITPRDVKMLLRLALRVAQAHGEPLTLSTFRRCAMFRAIAMEAVSATDD